MAWRRLGMGDKKMNEELKELIEENVNRILNIFKKTTKILYLEKKIWDMLVLHQSCGI